MIKLPPGVEVNKLIENLRSFSWEAADILMYYANSIKKLGQKNEIKFEKIKNYFTDTCFESKTLIQNRFSSHKLVKCKN